METPNSSSYAGPKPWLWDGSPHGSMSVSISRPSLTSPKRRESNISSHPPCKRRGVPLTQGCDGQASYKIVAYRSPLTMTNNQRTRTIAGV